MRIFLALGFLLALLPAPARAQEDDADLPELVQELFTAETTYPQEHGAVQLTVDARIEDGATARLLAEYGITDRLQVSVTTPYLELEEGGEEEMGVGALLGLVNGPAMAASVSLEVVRVTDGGDADVEWEPALAVARRVGAAQVHASVAAAFSADGTELTPGLGLMVDAGRVTPTLELTSTVAEGEAPAFAITPGLFLHLSPRFEIGVGAPVNLGASTLPNVLALVTLEL